MSPFTRRTVLAHPLIAVMVACVCIPVDAAAIDYEYDELNRLTGVAYEDGTVVSYAYDPAGNQLSRIVSSDGDGDGIRYAGSSAWCAPGQSLDCDDNCPTISNPDQADQDGDSVGDATDNCIAAANPRLLAEESASTLTGVQLDADGDGFGNACDADLDGDGVTNFTDLAILRARFFKTDAYADLTGDGVVNFQDLARMRASFFKPPGPRCAACPL